MSKVLYIKANPKSNESSNTFLMSEAFINEYQQQNPNDEIITLDLYKEGIKFIDENMLNDIFSGKEEETMVYAKQFAECDKYVIAAPMWNLGSPAILKAYFDYVSRVGVTFKYTETGPVGLLAGLNKKAIHIVARGGSYEGEGAKYDLGDPYIRTILGFFGVYDVQTASFDLTNVLMGEALEKVKKEAVANVVSIAQSF